MNTKPNILNNQKTINDYETLMQFGDNYLNVGDFPRAKDFYEKAAVLADDEAAPYAGLGTIAMQTGEQDEAEIAFRVACRLDHQCASAYAGLGLIARAKGQHEQAFEMYLKCLELDCDNLTALLGLFQASSEMGSFAKVIHYLEVYLNLHPNDSSVMFSLAALYMKENQYDRSETMLTEILRQYPDNEDAHNLLEEVQRNLPRTN